jgi:hypothetical protein
VLLIWIIIFITPLASALLRLMFLAKFRQDFNALRDSESNFMSAKQAYIQECSQSQTSRIAEELFRRKNAAQESLDAHSERWDLRLKFFSAPEQKEHGDLRKLVAVTGIVKDSVDQLKASKLAFVATCKLPMMREIKSHFSK